MIRISRGLERSDEVTVRVWLMPGFLPIVRWARRTCLGIARLLGGSRGAAPLDTESAPETDLRAA